MPPCRDDGDYGAESRRKLQRRAMRALQCWTNDLLEYKEKVKNGVAFFLSLRRGGQTPAERIIIEVRRLF